MEIKLSTVKKTLIVLLIVFAAVAAVRFVLPLGGRAEIVPTPTPDEGRAMAITAATAFLTMDVTDGQEAWIARLCDLAGGEDTNGCAYAHIMAEVYWPSVIRDKKRLTYEAQDAVLVRDFGGERQAWKISGTARDLNTGETRSAELHVAVIRENGVWRFDHVLLPQEVEALEANP